MDCLLCHGHRFGFQTGHGIYVLDRMLQTTCKEHYEIDMCLQTQPQKQELQRDTI